MAGGTSCIEVDGDKVFCPVLFNDGIAERGLAGNVLALASPVLGANCVGAPVSQGICTQQAQSIQFVMSSVLLSGRDKAV